MYLLFDFGITNVDIIKIKNKLFLVKFMQDVSLESVDLGLVYGV